MTKRFIVVGLLVAAFLALAAPALGFDGYRDTYYPTAEGVGCAGCHEDGTLGPAVYNDWAMTAHSQVGTVELDPVTGELIGGTANAEPIADGPGCAGCHSSNYKPEKHVPDPVTGVYPYQNTPDISGDDAFSEPFIGCSACHWGKNEASNTGPTAAHSAPAMNLANADICGQCHSRYSLSVVPYPNYDGTSAMRNYTQGNFSPLGFYNTVPPWAPEPIANYMNISTPTSPQQMIYYQLDGEMLPWQARAHEDGAAQYSQWANEGHANAYQALPASQRQNPQCLECHSTDYRIGVESGLSSGEAAANSKYGVTCVGCHRPHNQSEETSFWNEERNPQLRAPRAELCVECHNAEIPETAPGEAGVATPGSTVHHPMNEMMNGTGGIDVTQGSPSVHKGKCVQCHMVPTGWGRNPLGLPEGEKATAANHVFAIVEPEVAMEARTTGNVGGAIRPMPNSSCSTCHRQDGTEWALYLQEVLTNRQTAMHNWDNQTLAALASAGMRLGFTGADNAAIIRNANQTLNAKKTAGASWNTSQLNFQKGYTNESFVSSEGSWGIHNWEYARSIILMAKQQANAVGTLSVVTIQRDKSSVKVNAKVKFSGTVNTATSGTVTIQRKKGSGSWSNWKTVSLNAMGKYSTTQKMTSKGTFYFRARFAASATQIGGTSGQVKVVVK
jgi:hypothetical protein